MSVIVKNLKTNQIFLMSKGAETTILANSVSGDVQETNTAISKFAQQGWRTLAFAYKILTPQQYQSYNEMLISSYNDLYSREQKLAQALKQIESQLIVVGATGIEDKLQEDCAATLEKLRRGGIKIWVLTGDKRETAINISKSCKHFSNDIILLHLTDLPTSKEIESRLSQEYIRYKVNLK